MTATRMLRSGIVCLVFIGGVVARAEGGNLSEQLNSLFGQSGIVLDVRPPDPRFSPHTAHFSSSSLATLGLLAEQLAPSAADFPAISTVPGFTYRYDPQLLSFERSSTSLGPVFVERPQTLGRGKFDFGVSYLFIDFDELNGDDLDRLAFRGLEHNDCCGRPLPSPGRPPFENDTADLIFEEFTLRSHVASFFATYGVTDDWDVNVLLPVVFTSLDARARAVLNNTSGDVHFFDNEGRITQERRSLDDDAIGIGDLLVRTKYHLLGTEHFHLASGLTARVPTGEENDFQGLGDLTFAPFLALSQEYKYINLHMSSGIEVNADDLDRSRVRYAAGASVQVIEQFALMIGVIGSSSLATDRISVRVPQFSDAPPPAPPISFTRVGTSFRTDVVDLTIGFKVNPYGSVVGFFNVLTPLNKDGLRADVIPAAGVEISF